MNVSDNEAFSVYPGIQQPRRHYQGSNLSPTQCHSKDHNQGCPRSNQICTEHANIRLGSKMNSSMPMKPDGKSIVPSLMPHGCFHQRTNRVHQLQTNSVQPQLIHPSHSLCRQSSHLWRQTSYWRPTVRSPPGRWILWKTHHPRNGT